MSRVLMLVAALVLVACSSGAPTQPTNIPQTPTPTTSDSPQPRPTATPIPSASPEADFYLRAWYSQALPPRETFGWLPMLTVANGTLLDGNVAVPAIFPGPLWIPPVARPISEAGIAALLAEAERLGLLDGTSDFTGDAVMPGSRTAQLELHIDGTPYALTGVPDLAVTCDANGHCDAEPGTPAAFTAFWRELETASTWLEPELGPAAQYQPERVALLLIQPPSAEPGLAPSLVEWPFETPMAEAGVEFPSGAGERCVTLEGEALSVALPSLQSGTQLTVFVDEAGTQAAPVVRVLVPGEPSPCPD